MTLRRAGWLLVAVLGLVLAVRAGDPVHVARAGLRVLLQMG